MRSIYARVTLLCSAVMCLCAFNACTTPSAALPSTVASQVAMRPIQVTLPMAGIADSAVTIQAFEIFDFRSADSLVVQTEILPGQEALLARTNLPAGTMLLSRAVATNWRDNTSNPILGTIRGDFTYRASMDGNGRVTTGESLLVDIAIKRLGNALAIDGRRYELLGKAEVAALNTKQLE